MRVNGIALLLLLLITTMTIYYDNDINNLIIYLFTCSAEQPMANYRDSTNTNNSIKTTQDKTNEKQQKKQ
jgi:hypothetical protein